MGASVFAADPIIDLNAIDASVNPCDNFYQYACGAWIRDFKRPADHASYSRQASALGEDIKKQLSDILTAYARGERPVKAKYAGQLGAFYASCMDTGAIEKRSAAVLKKKFQQIDKIRSSRDFARTVAEWHLQGVGVLFSFGSETNPADSRRTIAALFQGGMSFADRGYYFNTDEKSAEIRQRFVLHVAKMFELSGVSPKKALADAQAVLKFETRLARKALPTEDLFDSTKLHHPMSLKQVKARVSHFGWDDYFRTLGFKKFSVINMSTPDFFTGLQQILAGEKLATLKIEMKWFYLKTMAHTLKQSLREENFAFWARYMEGQEQMQVRWKTCARNTQDELTEALGEAFVNSFEEPEKIRAASSAMIKEIEAAFGENLNTLKWLDAASLKAAHQKLSLVSDKVGFPAKWKNYDSVKISKIDFNGNVEAAQRFTVREDLRKIDKPTDRSVWGMGVWEQNAYYDPTMNQMVFPLGSLVPPIFDFHASKGANYGSIGGGWVGHELTHGFDSDGRNYDGHGNLKNWWSKSAAANFDKSAQCFIDQGNAYEILPGLKVNGKQVLTENIADIGGIKVGYRAFLKATNGNPSAPAMGPLNERQQFWIAYAQSYCSSEAEEYVRSKVQTDPHPPVEFRANIPLMNNPDFAADFSCKPGTRMAPVNRCDLW